PTGRRFWSLGRPHAERSRGGLKLYCAFAKSGSQQTRRWREMDSNFRYRGRRPGFWPISTRTTRRDRCRKKGVRIRQLLVCAALGREWWARRRSVLSVSDPWERAAREPTWEELCAPSTTLPAFELSQSSWLVAGVLPGI